jgi:hypothetical protein
MPQNDEICLICRADDGLVDAHSGTKPYMHLSHLECMREWLNQTTKILCPLCSQNFHPTFLNELCSEQPKEFILRLIRCMHSIDLEFLKQLIGSKVCDVEIYSQLLTDASEQGRIEVVELLVDIGVDARE